MHPLFTVHKGREGVLLPFCPFSLRIKPSKSHCFISKEILKTFSWQNFQELQAFRLSFYVNCPTSIWSADVRIPRKNVGQAKDKAWLLKSLNSVNIVLYVFLYPMGLLLLSFIRLVKGWGSKNEITKEKFSFADFLRMIVDEVKRNEHWFPQVCRFYFFIQLKFREKLK